MTAYETAIAALADALGTRLEIAPDRLCDIAVDGRLVVLRPIGEAETSIMMFTPVGSEPIDGRLPAAVKDMALSMNLFGKDTLGGHLGAFGESVILSSQPVEADGLDAKSFAEKLLVFSRFAGEVEKSLADAGTAKGIGKKDPQLASGGDYIRA